MCNGALTGQRGALRVRGRMLPWGARTYVMGIVNVSPDSFSGDGDPHAEIAAARALQQLADGADVVDVGAESTRPGHRPIGAEIERARLLPALGAIRAGAPDAIVSVDTFKADVFRDARAAGGDMLNSIWGAREDLIAACAETDAPIVVMHNKAVAVYERDVVDEVLAFLEAGAARCVRAGIAPEHVILDPGIGFGKTVAHNFELVRRLPELVAIGRPVVIGFSRKSALGRILGDPTASVGVAVSAYERGAWIIRAHDVRDHVEALRVARAVVEAP